ncbi:MAG: hypothetical protein WBD51_18700, partial [Burkholderiaceae bacterium]
IQIHSRFLQSLTTSEMPTNAVCPALFMPLYHPMSQYRPVIGENQPAHGQSGQLATQRWGSRRTVS